MNVEALLKSGEFPNEIRDMILKDAIIPITKPKTKRLTYTADSNLFGVNRELRSLCQDIAAREIICVSYNMPPICSRTKIERMEYSRLFCKADTQALLEIFIHLEDLDHNTGSSISNIATHIHT